MAKLLYFKDSEVINLMPPLPDMLDIARGISGIPYNITSGFRTQAHNDSLPNSVKNSAHLTGEAVDLSYTTSRQRYLILRGLYLAGFRRIGMGLTYIHADISKTLPPDTFFLEDGLVV